jgi:SET domain-containing protein
METLVSDPRIDPRYACFKMEIRPSKIHRFGVYAGERIPANRKVIEYTGERINRMETKRRSDGEFTYLFTLDNYWTLDGAFGGSGAEIINHSCEPNLVPRIVKGHIIYMSLRPIKRGEELTVDYNFTYTGDKSPCSCGAKKCRGIMEKLTPKLERELAKEKAARAEKKARAAKKTKRASV